MVSRALFSRQSRKMMKHSSIAVLLPVIWMPMFPSTFSRRSLKCGSQFVDFHLQSVTWNYTKKRLHNDLKDYVKNCLLHAFKGASNTRHSQDLVTIRTDCNRLYDCVNDLDIHTCYSLLPVLHGYQFRTKKIISDKRVSKVIELYTLYITKHKFKPIVSYSSYASESIFERRQW